MTRGVLSKPEMKIVFQGRSYKLVITDHAQLQMKLRGISEAEVFSVIETGESKQKAVPGKYWVYKELKGRKDNLIAVSISLEKPHLIVITTLVNWRPL